MGRFDKFADAPNAIKIEGQEIELKFQRTSDTTGRITWNIPAPSAGCDSSNQAYDGCVITVASKPANYLSNSPVNGTFYMADPSVDLDMNTGDRLDGAMVVGAFYNDRLTTILQVTDLQPKTAYYFSLYAVDNVCTYFREGVHSYSLPTGPVEPNSETDLPAIQDVVIDTVDGIGPSTITGLKPDGNYFITAIVDGKKYQLNIPGTLALDYDDLIYQINQEFIRLTDNKYIATAPPNAGTFYVDLPNEKVYSYDGFVLTATNALFDENDPSNSLDGNYWYEPDTDTLSIWSNSVWNTIIYKRSQFDISNPSCYNYWFDGTNAYEWEKVLWCQLPTYVSEVNPLMPPVLDCNTFWYNTNTFLVSQWDDKIHQWNVVNPIYFDTDPNSIPSGTYWYNQTNSQVYYFAGAQWNLLNNVNFSEPDANGDFVGLSIANMYWFIPSQQKLFRRDAGDTVWVNIDIIIYVNDPRDRVSCQLWWDALNDVLNIWDVVNTRWVQVSQFFQQALDPSSPKDIPLNSAWYNPATRMLTIINNPDCTATDFVYSAVDPTQIQLNDIWHDPVANIWRQWDGSGWLVIYVMVDIEDPYHLVFGDLWFNTASNELNQWDGTQFNLTIYSLTPLTPTLGDLWFEPLSEILYQWNGTSWEKTIGVAAAKLILRSSFRCDTCKSPTYNVSNYSDGIPMSMPTDTIRFYTKALGCGENIQLCFDDGMSFVFANISQSVIYGRPIPGYSRLDSGPMYEQIGVGSDGSPDERRNMDAIVRSMLGDPATKVELTKQQINICIDNALKTLRKNSNLSYKRGFFFLDVYPKQQTYLLKDKCVGFNKIVDVNTIYRTRAGLFGAGAFGGDGLFAYSMLQNLYQMGTFDMLSYHLVSSYTKELQTMFADYIMFQWREKTRELKMNQIFYGVERVLLDVTVERTEQDLMTDRETTMWLQKWTMAEAKLMLSQSRGKYQVLAGPNGNVTLNAQDLISQAQQEMQALTEELFDFVMQDTVDSGMRSHFIIG
jgi:hypothetical protein